MKREVTLVGLNGKCPRWVETGSVSGGSVGGIPEININLRMK